MIDTPAFLSSCCPNARSSSSWSVYGLPPTTSFPVCRSWCALAPWPSTSSNTTTSAHGTSRTQSSVLGTNPSAISRSLSASQNSFTSWPSFTTCHAMSAISPSSETKRNFFLSKAAPGCGVFINPCRLFPLLPSRTAGYDSAMDIKRAGGSEHAMKGAVLYRPRDIRFEEREAPRIVEPTDAILRLSATCICGSDLWPYRGISPVAEPAPMGHEYCGIVEEVGQAVKSVRPGQFVIGSFATSDNTCPHCRYGYQSSCVHREFISGAQAPVYACRSRTARSWPCRSCR